MSRTKPENQTAYYQEHPPKCVAEFLARPAWLDNIDFDGHGFSGMYPDGLVANPNIVFAIKCQCGGSMHRIIAESEQEEIWQYKNLVIAERYFLECSSCHSRHLFFDKFLHGYNAEGTKIEALSLSEFVETNQPLVSMKILLANVPTARTLNLKFSLALNTRQICLMSLCLKEKSMSSFRGLQELESAAPVQPSICS